MKKRNMVYSVYLVVGIVLCVWGVLHLNELVQRTNQINEQLTVIANDTAPDAPGVAMTTPPMQVPLPPPTPLPPSAPEKASVVAAEPTVASATYITPRDSDSLMPLEGWVDQPNKDRPGRVHTNLMVRFTSAAPAYEPSLQRPCLKPERFPAEIRELPYGWISLPARTILVPCGTR